MFIPVSTQFERKWNVKENATQVFMDFLSFYVVKYAYI